jgi:hypothetical protein
MDLGLALELESSIVARRPRTLGLKTPSFESGQVSFPVLLRARFEAKPIQLNHLALVSAMEDQLDDLVGHICRKDQLNINEGHGWTATQLVAIKDAFRVFLLEEDFPSDSVAIAWISNSVSSPATEYNQLADESEIACVDGRWNDELRPASWPAEWKGRRGPRYPGRFAKVFKFLVENRTKYPWLNRSDCALYWRRCGWESKLRERGKPHRLYLQHLCYGSRSWEDHAQLFRGHYPLFCGVTIPGRQELLRHMDFDLLSIGVITRCCTKGRWGITSFGFSFEHRSGDIINAIFVEQTPLRAWLMLRSNLVGRSVLGLC